VRSQLKPGDIFWDIGANFGLYSIIASTIVGPEGQVLAIEPDPRNIKRLRRNIYFNRLFNSITVYQIPFALGEVKISLNFRPVVQEPIVPLSQVRSQER